MKYIVDIKGEIDGDYEIIGKYEERPQGDLISRTWLKEHKFTTQVCNGVEIEDVDVVAVATIDNALTVEPYQGEECVNIKMSEEEIKRFKQMLQEHIPLYTITSDTFVEGATVERPQGEWIEVKEEVHYDYWSVCECSLCKHSWALGELSIEDVKDDYKFCPNCGAEMRKEAENERR